ncbi:hypothetical protein SFUMM280S_01357 [Streptomyces fumanus]
MVRAVWVRRGRKSTTAWARRGSSAYSRARASGGVEICQREPASRLTVLTRSRVAASSRTGWKAEPVRAMSSRAPRAASL